jgi:hypothetical protein
MCASEESVLVYATMRSTGSLVECRWLDMRTATASNNLRLLSSATYDVSCHTKERRSCRMQSNASSNFPFSTCQEGQPAWELA